MKNKSERKQILDYAYPEKIDHRYTCAICSDITTGPTILPCSHIFCLKCIEVWMREKKSCPTCRAKVQLTRLLVDEQVEEEVENLKVYCPYHPERCTWKGLKKEYEDHKKECKYALIPSILEYPIDRDEENFEEFRNIDPGSVFARVIKNGSEEENKYLSIFLQYMADRKMDEENKEEKQTSIKRAVERFLEKKDQLKTIYPEYFQELKLRYLEEHQQDQETAQVQRLEHPNIRDIEEQKQNEKYDGNAQQEDIDSGESLIRDGSEVE